MLILITGIHVVQVRVAVVLLTGEFPFLAVPRKLVVVVDVAKRGVG
jgi:hypothetical protein